jgi:nucleoside-diphosphate-sugar epimerase
LVRGRKTASPSGPAAQAATVVSVGIPRRRLSNGTAMAAATTPAAAVRTAVRSSGLGVDRRRFPGTAGEYRFAVVSGEGPFEGRTAAVTGAGGFIGGAICRRLAAGGAEVRGLDIEPALAGRVSATGATFVEADVIDPEQLERALEGVELVVHAAAFVTEYGRMEDFVRVNVGGTARVLDAAEAAGVERAVHISSVVVYGYDHPGEQDESAHLRAYGIPYIDTKSASDRLARHRGAIVVRPGDVYGPGSVPWVVRPVEMARAGRLAVPGEGDGLMLAVYVDDLVEAVALALERGTPAEAYTAWSGERVTFGEYFDRIAEIAGARRPRRLPRGVLRLAGAAVEAWAARRGRPPLLTGKAVTFVDRRGTVSNRRACEELGWEPQVDLDEGLRRTEAWLRAEGLV